MKSIETFLESFTDTLQESVLDKQKVQSTEFLDIEYYEESGEFNSKQLESIGFAFASHLEPEEIQYIANPDFDAKTMTRINYCFQAGFKVKDVKEIMDSKKLDDYRKTDCLKCMMNDKNPKPKLKILSNPKFNNEQMAWILDAFENNVPLKNVQLFANPKFDADIMKSFCVSMKWGLTYDQAKEVMNPRFDADQYNEIFWGLMDNIPMEEVKTYADPKFNAKQMEKMRIELAKKHNLPY